MMIFTLAALALLPGLFVIIDMIETPGVYWGKLVVVLTGGVVIVYLV